jgi:hypothetical protein
MKGKSQSQKRSLKKESRTKEQLNKAWKLFQPQMEYTLFHTTALIDNYYQIRTLIDDGAACYVAINKHLI